MSLELNYNDIIELIKSEVKPALGCTEPVAVALAVASSKSILEQHDCLVRSVEVEVSANIMKNGMGVGIPGTEMVGLHIASALGVTCGVPEYGLEVLKDLTDTSLDLAKQFIKDGRIVIKLADNDIILYISATCYGNNLKTGESHSATTIVKDQHDNIIFKSFDKSIIYSKDNQTDSDLSSIDVKKVKSARELNLTVRSILDFASNAEFKDIEFILETEKLNRALAEEGLKNDYGLMVGKKLAQRGHKQVFGEGYMTHAMSYTAAASDARMAGCPLPAMSNSGSGNQGITVTLPVVAIYDKLGIKSNEKLARALILSHLIAIHIKSYLGRLSALCGCIVASAGSSCGIIYLNEGDYKQMCAALKNMIGNITGMVCDGAKVGCALKVASGVSSAIQSAVLAMDNICISPNDGIIEEDIEKTIRNLALIGSDGMKYTDRMILRIMSTK